MKMLYSKAFRRSKATLPVALGYNPEGKMFVEDLAEMPHAMYVGATNSGKSSGLVSLTLSLMVAHPTDNMNLVIFDIGASSMDLFADAPHLSYPIVRDIKAGLYVMKTLETEMERRIELGCNELKNLPFVICIIDEYISFLDNINDNAEQKTMLKALSNLLRRGLKAKMHFVLATQNPSPKDMKADIGNITARMVFACATYHGSVTALNCAGAEKLSGKGAMLYRSREYGIPIYLQGSFIGKEEAAKLMERIKEVACDASNKFVIPPFIDSEPEMPPDTTSETVQNEHKDQKELARIIMWTLERVSVSVDQIKKGFSMGNRANEIMDQLQTLKIVTEKYANQPRKVLPKSIDMIADDTMALLEKHGYSREDIAAALTARSHESEY